MMRRLQKIFTTLGILVAAFCITNVTVKADLIYNTKGELIDTYNFNKFTNATDGSYRIVSSEAGTISYYDANGNLLKVVNKNTGEIIISNQEEETTTENETTTVEEITTKEVEKITLPKVKKLKKKTKWSKYKGVKAVKKDKNKTPIWGKIKYRYGITVSWKRVKGVTGYEIYRYENAAKKWTKIKTINKNKKKPSYTLTDMLKGENVKIKVRAYKNTKSGKVYGEYSDVLKFKTKNMYTKIYKNGRKKKFYSKWASQDAFVIQNKYRKVAGVNSLTWSNTLYEVAVVRAKEGYSDFSHKDFRNTMKRILINKYTTTVTDVHYLSLRSTENLAQGYGTPKKVMKAWKKSTKGHYGNMIDEDMTLGAIAVYSGRNNDIWTAIFSDVSKEGETYKAIDEKTGKYVNTWHQLDFSFLN